MPMAMARGVVVSIYVVSLTLRFQLIIQIFHLYTQFHWLKENFYTSMNSGAGICPIKFSSTVSKD